MTADGQQEPENQQVQAHPAPAASGLTVPPLAPNSIPTTPAAIETAGREAQGLADGNLDQIARRNHHTRRETIRNIVHWLKISFLLLISVLIILAVLIVAIHWMTPWYFLSDGQLKTLQTMLASSLVTGIATTMGKNILKDVS